MLKGTTSSSRSVDLTGNATPESKSDHMTPPSLFDFYAAHIAVGLASSYGVNQVHRDQGRDPKAFAKRVFELTRAMMQARPPGV